MQWFRGGALFRAALATLLLAEPAPQLLLLDEPTNSLASVRQYSGALRSYPGALVVASHDTPFLREIGITRWLRLDGEDRHRPACKGVWRPRWTATWSRPARMATT